MEYARDEAIAARGMGLGGVDGKGAVEGGEILVEDKKGKKRVVRDRTEIYVDQAWVGRGTYEQKPDHRAFGRVYAMQCPYTSELVSWHSLRCCFRGGCLWMDGLLITRGRYFGGAEGGGDEDAFGEGEGAKAGDEEGVGAFAG